MTQKEWQWRWLWCGKWKQIWMQATSEVLTAVLFNPLNAELNPICPLLALFGAHHILHVSRKMAEIQVTWAVTLCWLVSSSRRFERSYWFRSQGQTVLDYMYVCVYIYIVRTVWPWRRNEYVYLMLHILLFILYCHIYIYIYIYISVYLVTLRMVKKEPKHVGDSIGQYNIKSRMCNIK